MSRSRKDELAHLQDQVEPPSWLNDGLVGLWHREFDRFPPGYFTPSDASGMRVYLETLAEYETARKRAAAARSLAAKRAEGDEVRAIRGQLISLQRALRMYPATLAHPATAGRMAHDPARQAAMALDDDVTDEPAWRRMMREAGATKSN